MFFLLFLFIVTVQNSYSVCNESYMIFCDCVNDLKNYKVRNWTDLVIGSDHNNNFCQSSTINEDTFDSFEEIKLLFIVNQVSNIHQKSFESIAQTLKYLTFYGNALKLVKTLTFSGFRKLSRLSLVNNNIETVEEYSFKGSVIKNLDLSRNEIQSIVEHTFDGGKITRITIRYNKLAYINPNAFNKHVEVLNLDHNNLESIASGFLNNLPGLRELSLSHNRLSHVSDISSLTAIQKMDFSFNKINSINSEEFEELKNLVYLDLSSNKLETFSLKHLKKVSAERFTLLLSYNHLTNLKIKEKRPTMTLTLFGNPWNCDCLTKLEKSIMDLHFTRTKCDLELFGNSNKPICIEQGECQATPVQNRDDLDRFLKAIDLENESFTCDLFHEVSGKHVVPANFIKGDTNTN